MLGVNWAVVGCGTSRGTNGIGIFKLSAAKNGEYKNIDNFNIDNFRCILNQKLNNLSSTAYDDFEEIFLHLLNKHAPLTKNITTQ